MDGVLRCLVWTVWLVQLSGSICYLIWSLFSGRVLLLVVTFICSRQCHCLFSVPLHTFLSSPSAQWSEMTRSEAIFLHFFRGPTGFIPRYYITVTHTHTRLTAHFLGLPVHQHLTTQFFTGRMPFLPPNQQRQSVCYYITVTHTHTPV